MRTRLLFLLIPLLCSPAACGDDSGSSPADAAPTDTDGGPDIDADIPDGYPFDDGADFDHANCDSAPALDQVALRGIWHMDIDYDDFGSSASVMRFNDPEGALTAFYTGVEMQELSVSATDILIRLAYTDSQERERVYAFDVCAKDSDGNLHGRYAVCTDGDCYFASVLWARVDPFDTEEAVGITKVSEYNGPADAPWPVDDRNLTVNVRHLDTTAYVARYEDGLRIVDISDPTAPQEVAHIPVKLPDAHEIFNDIKVVSANGKTYALCASSRDGVIAYDVTDPQNWTEVSAFPPLTDEYVNVHTLFIDGTRAFLANTSESVSGLDIYDIADPEAPVFLGRYQAPDLATLGGFVHDLYVKDGRAYLNYWNRGMYVVDAQDPTAPEVVGVFDNYSDRRTSHSVWVTEAGGKPIAVHGGEDFGAHVRIVDLTTAPTYEEIGSFETRPQVSVHNIMAVGERALVTYYQDGFRVLDLSNPAQPTEIAHFATWKGTQPAYGNSFYEGAIGVDYNPDNGDIYLADTHRGLFILRLDP